MPEFASMADAEALSEPFPQNVLAFGFSRQLTLLPLPQVFEAAIAVDAQHPTSVRPWRGWL